VTHLVDDGLPAPLRIVLRDLLAHCAVSPTIREVADGSHDEDEAVLMLYAPDGTGHGVTVRRGDDLPRDVADLAEQVQGWAVEALWGEGLPAVWPQCPTHPDTHPLTADVDRGSAVWRCPRSGTVIAPVGRLPV
jgi:hypothetical protein